MILFKKIRWKNFLSTGNTFVEIELNKSQMTLMIGANGSGKSTMLDALTFALFNRPFRLIKKEQIVNTINNAQFNIGKIEGQKHSLLHELGAAQGKILKLQEIFTKEYGSTDINIKDGTINKNNDEK